MGDPQAAAYKDWLHLNLFLPDEGIVALVNVSLHGPASDLRSRVVGVALAAGADGVWYGGIEITDFKSVTIESKGIYLQTVSLGATRTDDALLACIRFSGDGLTADIRANPCSQSFTHETRFGSGWIGWSAVPLLELDGSICIDNKIYSLSGAFAYHDHNWGRWFWGEDVAWEWGAFVLPDKTVAVFTRATNKAHRHLYPSHLVLVRGNSSYVFQPGQVNVSLNGRMRGVQRRLPGALATIHADRCHPDLPSVVRIRGESALASLQLEFVGNTAAQLIVAEPTRPGTAFINEIAGTCSLLAIVEGTQLAAQGSGIFEYVE